MSDSDREPAGKPVAGYSPAKSSSRISIDDLRTLKELLNDSGLTKWIVLAGIGGLVDIFHTAWLAIRWLKGF
jgi:hypothetical protein